MTIRDLGSFLALLPLGEERQWIPEREWPASFCASAAVAERANGFQRSSIIIAHLVVERFHGLFYQNTLVMLSVFPSPTKKYCKANAYIRIVVSL